MNIFSYRCARTGVLGIALVGLITGSAFAQMYVQTKLQEITSGMESRDTDQANGGVPVSEAYHQVVKIYNDWEKLYSALPGFHPYQSTVSYMQPSFMPGRPGGMPGMSNADPSDPATKMAAVGYSNLTEIKKIVVTAESKTKDPSELLSYSTMLSMVNNATHLALMTAPPAQLVEAAEEDPAYFQFIYQQRFLWRSPEVTKLIQDKLMGPNTLSTSPSDSGSNPANSSSSTDPSAFIKLINGDDGNASNSKSQTTTQARSEISADAMWHQPAIQGRLLEMAFANGDPSLQSTVNQYIQNVLQNTSTDDHALNAVVLGCLQDKSGQYESSMPALLSLYNSERDKKGDDTKFASFDVVTYLSHRPKLCIDPKMQQVARDMLAHEQKLSGPNDAKNTCLDALFGNSDSLQKVMAQFQANLANPQPRSMVPSAGLGSGIEAAEVLDGIAYNGAGGKVQGVIDNISTAAFDGTLGQWVITAPTDYTNSSTDKNFLFYHPANKSVDPTFKN